MKLLHLKDQTEKYEIKAIAGIEISVKVYDIQKLWSDLQNLVQEVAKDEFDGIVVSARLGSPRTSGSGQVCDQPADPGTTPCFTPRTYLRR